jgi:Fur family ferric uptake transcriptional regulator
MESIADIQTLLRKSGLRSTSPRVAVLKILLTARQPMSHGDLADKLEKEGHDKTTIFRNLTDMTESGLLSRIDVGDHVWRFELRRELNADGQSHAHFVCTDCGDVDCLPEFDFKVSTKDKASKAKMGNVSEILLKGHCGDCGDSA